MLILTNWVLKWLFVKKIWVFPPATELVRTENFIQSLLAIGFFFRKPYYVHHNFFSSQYFWTANKKNWWGVIQITENLVLRESGLQICMWRWNRTVQNCRDASETRCSRLTLNLKINLQLGLFRLKKALMILKWMDFLNHYALPACAHRAHLV